MPLRLTLTLVPGGDDRDAACLGHIDICNVSGGADVADYYAEPTILRDGTGMRHGCAEISEHVRSDGAWLLARRALDALVGERPDRGRLINADATASARVVEAREAIGRARHPADRALAAARLSRAEAEHRRARVALEAGGGR